MVYFALALHLAAAGFAPWSHPLSLANGGVWRERVPVVVRNRGAAPLAGTIVSVTVGKGVGQADLVGAAAQSVRVCGVNGAELLFELTSAAGKPLHSGPVPDGAVLRFPVECAAGSETTSFIYLANPRAGLVPDYLVGSGGLVNAGVEDGEGTIATGWQHDAPDSRHRAWRTQDQAHSGRWCLATEVATGAEPTWIATRQGGIRMVAGARYRMTAWVRARDVQGEAGWYIHVGNAANGMMISPMLPAGPGSYDWKQVTAEFVAPPGADTAELGTVLRGTGAAWFDDVALACLDGQEPVEVAPGTRERLAVSELGRPAPPAPGSSTRTITVTNLTDEACRGGLVSAPAAALTAGRALGTRVQVTRDGKPVPSYTLADVILFPGDAPARTIRRFDGLLVKGAAKRASASSRDLPREYAPNPAVPGGADRSAKSVDLAEYARLLADPRNLVKNPGFEAGDRLPAAWPGAAEGNQPGGAVMDRVDGGLFGRKCARISIPAGATLAWTGWRQDVPVRPGATYLLAAWLRCKDLSGGAQVHVHLRTATGELVKQGGMGSAGPAISGTQGWTLLAGTFTVPDDCRIFQIHLTMLATGTLWHDGVVLVETSPGEVGELRTGTGPSRPAPAIWSVDPIRKVFRDDTPPAAPAPVAISCAGNEYEPLQLAVRWGRAIGNVQVACLGPVDGTGHRLPAPEVGVVGYVPIDAVTNYYSNTTPAYYRKLPTGMGGSDGWPGWWPDPILPRDRFSLASNQTQPIWLTFHVPMGTRPGLYRGSVELRWDGRVQARVPYSVRVRVFSLPDRTHLKAVFDTRQSGAMWQVPGKSEQETREVFWRFMAARRVCPDTIKPEPTLEYRDGKVVADWTEFDRAARLYFDELHFPHAYTPWHFYLFGWGHVPAEKFGQQPYEGAYPFEGKDRALLRPEYKRAYQACLKAYWEHMKEKGWSDRITLYISDEPADSDPRIVRQMSALCDMIREVDPAIPIYSSTWHHQPAWDRKLSVWGIGHYGIVTKQKMAELQRAGATIWWTTDGQMCTDTPYCAIERLLPHYCFKYGAKAYEFWGIDWLTYDPYQYGWHGFLLHDFGPGTEKQYVRYPNGDGFLAYPPAPIGATRPVSSVRLEQAREGVEDYEYLYLLRSLVAGAPTGSAARRRGEAALAAAAFLVESPCEIGRYSTRILPDPGRVLRVRDRVAEAIEGLAKGRQ